MLLRQSILVSPTENWVHNPAVLPAFIVNLSGLLLVYEWQTIDSQCHVVDVSLTVNNTLNY